MFEAAFPFIVIGVCAVPWLLALSARFGLPLALGGALAGAMLVVMGALFISSALSLDPIASTVTAIAIVGIAGIVVLQLTPGAIRKPQRSTIARWLPASIGALAWIGLVAVAQFLPGAAPLSWAMNGDTPNNIHMGRYFIENNGLTSRYVVPLSGGLLLLGMAPGRNAADESGLLEHDLVAFTLVWTLELALLALLLGLVVSALVPAHRTALAAIASSAGALLSATWFIAGLPIEYGYLSAHLALPFLLASWLAFLHSRRFPVAALVVELGLGVALLATWTPLIVFSVGFVLAILLRQRTALRALRGRPLIVLGVACLAFLIPLLLFEVPALPEGISVLLLPGHGMPFTGWIVAVLVGISIGGAILIGKRTSLPILSGTIGVAIAGAVGIGALLFINRQVAEPWSSYYPAKLTWLVSVTLVPIAIAAAFRVVAEFARPKQLAVVLAVVLSGFSLVLAAAGPAPTRESFVITQPVEQILLGKVWNTGDAAVAKILGFIESDRRHILWDSTDPDEAMINFWILEFTGGDRDTGGPLREFALRGYRELRDTGDYEPGDVAELCAVASELEPPVFIHTADPQLSSALTTACPSLNVTVLVDG